MKTSTNRSPRRIPRPRTTALALCLIAAVSACKPAPTPTPPAPPQVQRLVHARLGTPSPIENETPNVDASWSVRNARAVENTAEGLHILWGEEPAVLSLSGTIHAHEFAVFAVRMRINPGAYPQEKGAAPEATFRWQTRLDPAPDQKGEHKMLVFADGQYHNYSVPLRRATESTWLDQVTAVEFMPTSVPADVLIEKMELVRTPQTIPKRIEIADETHEALFGSQAPWTLRVPPRGRFETHVGISTRAWDRQKSDGATFRVSLETATGERIQLGQEKLNPSQHFADRKWRSIQANLEDHAGEEITLHLDIDHGQTFEGDYAYWGSPIVFQSGVEPQDIPVFLISNDTLRADRLGGYGHDRDTSPNLDAFRNDAVLFQNAMCPESWTLPSHMTMLTGLEPNHHGVSHTVNLREEVITLAELLQTSGYLTAAFTGINGYLNASYGFPQGFDRYNSPAAFRTIQETQALLLDSLDQQNRGQSFYFFHNFDIHSKPPKPEAKDPYFKLPYHTNSPDDRHFAASLPLPSLFTFQDPTLPVGTTLLDSASFNRVTLDDQAIEYLLALYDDGIRYVDGHLGIFFDELKQRGIYDQALIIVTADHGEEFHEHGRYLHYSIHEECQHIPLLIKFPQNEFAGQTISPVVKLADIVPTTLDVLGIDAPPQLDGQSLFAVLRGTEAPNDEAFGRRNNNKVIRTQRWRLAKNDTTGQRTVYDMQNDPKAIHPVDLQTVADLPQLERQLDEHYTSQQQGWNIQCQSLATHGETKLHIEATFDSSIGEIEILRRGNSQSQQFDNYEITQEGRHISATLTLFAEDTDTLVLLPTEGNYRMDIQLRTNRMVDINFGGRAPIHTDTGITGVLDPQEQKFPRPIDIPSRLITEPRITIWFEKPQAPLPAATTLSPQQKEQLHALGYLDN